MPCRTPPRRPVKSRWENGKAAVRSWLEFRRHQELYADLRMVVLSFAAALFYGAMGIVGLVWPDSPLHEGAVYYLVMVLPSVVFSCLYVLDVVRSIKDWREQCEPSSR